MSYQLAEEAALTILLHAAKYPSCTVCGVLLGKQPAGGKGGWSVVAAVPLFHLSMLLAPCVETALTQVEAYAQQRGLVLLGYYHAEARFDAQDVHPAGKRIADRIAERQPDALIVAVDGPKLAAFCREGSSAPPLEPMLREGGGAPRGAWKRAPGGLELGGGGWDALRARFLNLHAAGAHARLADFDEHMDDLARDYLNEALLEDLRGAGAALVSK